MVERTRYLRRPKRGRWRRWAEGIDPWHPRPADYVLAVLALLLLALLWIGERTWAMQLNRRLFALEERVQALGARADVLACRANELADRGRITSRAARDFGFVVPKPDDYRTIAFVKQGGARPGRQSGLGALAAAAPRSRPR